MNDGDLYLNVLVISILILSTAFHEMAHAYVATWLGDPTPGRHGRLTINPFPHLQPVLTAIIIPLVMYLSRSGFMILAQTPIDPSRFKKPLRDHALVAVAGPITNMLCAFVLLGALWIPGIWESGPETIRMTALKTAGYYNVVLAVFNMLPFPPLDGYWIVRGALPLHARRATDNFARQSFSLIICLLVGSQVMQLFEPAIVRFVVALLPRW